MCSCECLISAKGVNYFLLTWHNIGLIHLKDKSHNAQNRRSGEISIRIFETYKNYVQTHGCHIYNTATYMDMSTLCPWTS